MSGELAVRECPDWQTWRAIRLEALADTPIGFGELHADALARTDEEWQERWRTQTSGPRLLAFAGDRVVGMAGGYVPEDGRHVLVAVYVRPGARGQGVLDALVAAVAAWAAPDDLHLDVHVDNAPARRAYERLGWAYNGSVTPGGGIDGRDLVGMTLPLQAEGRSR